MRHLVHLFAAFVLVLAASRSSSAAGGGASAAVGPSPTAFVFEAVDAVTTSMGSDIRIWEVATGTFHRRLGRDVKPPR